MKTMCNSVNPYDNDEYDENTHCKSCGTKIEEGQVYCKKCAEAKTLKEF
jgi:hypothetical protein